MSAAKAFADEIVNAILDRLTTDPATAQRLRLALAPAAQPPGPCTRDEAARALRVSKATLDRAVRHGCPVHHVGARRRFEIDEVRAWFASRGKSSVGGEDIDVSGVARRAGFKTKRGHNAANA